MNMTNLNRLIDHLRIDQPDSFNMGDWLVDPDGLDDYTHVWEVVEEDPAPCGTVACIAGHIALAFTDELDQSDRIDVAAAKWLETGTDLFYGRWAGSRSLECITLDETIEHLESLAVTAPAIQERPLCP